MVVIKVKGRDNYWRFTISSWLVEIQYILERELGDMVLIEVENGENEDPEIYIDDSYVGSGVPGEEGYLVELIKKAYYSMKGHVDKD